MPTKFNVPELGENIESGTVAKVLVAKGDTVTKDQTVVELETDKAVAEVPCDIEGIVEEILIKQGDEVRPGQTLLTLRRADDDGAQTGIQDAAAPKEPEQPSARKEKAGKPAETDPPRAVANAANAKSKDQKPDRTPHAAPAAPESETANHADGPAEADAARERDEPPVPAAPSTRRFAREIGIDIRAVSGSGPHGRISIDDVKRHARSQHAGGGTPHGMPQTVALPDFSAWGTIERKAMSKVRRLTAAQMSRAWAIVPHAVQFAKADVTDIEGLRHRYQKDAEAAGGHLSLTVILLKTVAGALKAFPQFNASVDTGTGEIVFKKYFNVGVAVDTDRGLVVPVLRELDRKNVIELAVELKQVTEKARAGKLAVEDMRGGNMTITNAGALGGDTFIPIVNWPEVAILGVGRGRVEPVYQDGTFVPRTMLPLSLSYDHRLIDGADGVRFLRWIVEALEEPMKLAWEG